MDVELADEIEFLRKKLEHNRKVKNDFVVGDKVRLKTERGAFKKFGQTFTTKIYTISSVGLNTVRVEGRSKTYKIYDILKVGGNPIVAEPLTPAVPHRSPREVESEANAERRLQREHIDSIQDLCPVFGGRFESGRARRVPTSNPFD